ncbi:predicted protein [Streptomyces sp. SPB78]|uniref:hypothetical protein n=1 Tax=Streptomyces sp. (strain SPB78) TaxID=591157 RepID=UPI0001DED8AF|nr:hypothetical protein [Streptomyces sp. SPB78]EFK99536.1 predicted protein [Streptomyces sp. SPB78]
MSRRAQRAERKRAEALGVDTRTGELPAYDCPPELTAPAVVEDWLSSEELRDLNTNDAMIRARRRWVDARDAYAEERPLEGVHLRARVTQLCGPSSRPRWRDR